MQIKHEEQSVNKGLSISYRRTSLQRGKRNDARSSTPKIGVSQFPSIDLSFFNKRQLIIENEIDLKALEILKTIIPTDETIPDKQLNDIIHSIRQTSYYEVRRGLTEDGNPAILLPVCYKTFQYGIGLALYDLFDKAKGNKVDTKALHYFCLLMMNKFGYTFEDYHGNDMRRDMLEEILMNNPDNEERKECQKLIHIMDTIDILEAKIMKLKLPVHKKTYARWINASTFKKGIKKSFIKVWDLKWNPFKYGTRDAIENGHYIPAYSTVLFPNEELFNRINEEQNVYQEEGICDYVYDWLITCKDDLKEVNYEDKPLEQFFKWYDQLTNIL